MIKLFYLANVRFPSERAHATQIAHMCQAFTIQGIEVTLITSNRKAGDELSFEEMYGFSPHFTHQTVNNGWSFGTGITVGFLLSELVFLWHVFSKGHLSSFEKVYVRDEILAWLVSWFVATDKLVWESHEAKYSFFARRLLKKGVKIVCISEGIKDVYEKKGVPEQQLLVAHDGIDESFFAEPISQAAARERLGLPLDRTIAMYIGGFDAWKGVETFFKAAVLAPEVMFVAIGGTEELVEQYQNEYSNVTFLGAKPYKDLVYNQQAADVLVIPNSATASIGATYTSPLKLFAHMASSVPLVVSRVPSLESVLGEQGSYFTPDDATSLAQVVNTVIKGSKKEKPTVFYGMAKRFTWTRRASAILSFVRNNHHGAYEA